MRNWKSLSTSFATLSARVSSTLGVLIINGVAKRHMTDDQFGLWTILYAVNLLTNALDFGFCFTLGIRLAALGARGAEAEEERRETFLSVLFLQAAIAVVIMLITYLIFPLLPWPRWFKVTDPHLIAQVQGLMPVILMLMVSTLPVALMWTAFFAYQEIRLASFLSLGCTILQGAVFVISSYSCSFVWILVNYFISATVLGVLVTIYLFIHRRWSLTLLPADRIFATLRSLARVSSHAFFNTMSAIVSTVLGTLVTGHASGLAAAGDFALIQKLFSFLVTSHLAILAPVAPPTTRDSHAGNWDAIRHRLNVCLLQIWPAVFFLLGPLIWWVHPILIRLWTGHALTLYSVASPLLLWACLSGFVNTFSVFLNSLGLIKLQAALSFTMIIPSLILTVLLSRWLGMEGIALSMLLCTLPAALIWPFYTRRALRLHLHRV